MDPHYNPTAKANKLSEGDNVLDDYSQNQEDNDEFSIEEVTPGVQEEVNPYARSEAVASLPIPGINS
jgi:hypothetical protein